MIILVFSDSSAHLAGARFVAADPFSSASETHKKEEKRRTRGRHSFSVASFLRLLRSSVLEGFS